MAMIKDNSTGAKRHIHKLISNSLFGRMGMNSTKDITDVVTQEQAERIFLSHNVIDNFNVDDKLEYIRYNRYPDKDLCEQSGLNFEELLLKVDDDSYVNASLPIAAATTS
jgi:hypothetical protein